MNYSYSLMPDSVNHIVYLVDRYEQGLPIEDKEDLWITFLNRETISVLIEGIKMHINQFENGIITVVELDQKILNWINCFKN